MSTEKPKVEEPPPKPNAIASGQAFIGLCNTRGVALQLFTQRSLQALFVNLAGLAAVIGWLATDRPKYALLACALGVLLFSALNGLGTRAIRGSAASVDLWTDRLIALENTNKVDGNVNIFSSQEYADLRAQPALSAGHLIAAVYLCMVVWGIVGIASLMMFLQKEGIEPWNTWLAILS